MLMEALRRAKWRISLPFSGFKDSNLVWCIFSINIHQWHFLGMLRFIFATFNLSQFGCEPPRGLELLKLIQIGILVLIAGMEIN